MDNFKTKLNMNIIMDVLLDELHIIRTKQELISKIKTIFDSNVKLFINNPTPKTSVLELNKLFLRQVVMAVKQLLPNLATENATKQITITDEPATIEHIQQGRQQQFQEQLSKRQHEFDTLLNPPKPPIVDFSDKTSSIDFTQSTGLTNKNEHLIDDNNAIQNIVTLNPSNTEDWLKSTETSIKTEKQKEYALQSSLQTNKHVTFEQPLDETLTTQSNQITDIFDKLKKKSNSELTDATDETPNLVSKKYQEQQSALLPEVVRPILTHHNNNIIPSIIPSNDIKEQLELLNTKFDILQSQLNKIAAILDVKDDATTVNV